MSLSERLDRLHVGLPPEPIYYKTDGDREVRITPSEDEGWNGFAVWYKDPDCDWRAIDWCDTQIDAELRLWDVLGASAEPSVSVRPLPGCFESRG